MAQMNIVRLNRFCTNTEDILCKADGKCKNSSAMTSVSAAQSTRVVNAKAANSFMHRGNMIVWQHTTNSHMIKQHAMFDLNMSSRKWQN